MDAAIKWAKPENGRVDMITFSIDRRVFALPIKPVHQIIEMATITPLPLVNGGVVGVINFHGAIVPVVNLGTYLGLPPKAPQLHTPIILVTVFGCLIGLIVDDVQDVVSRPSDEIISSADILPEELGETPLLLGVVHVQDKMVMLLNLEHLLQPIHANLLAAVSSAVKKQAADVKANAETRDA